MKRTSRIFLRVGSIISFVLAGIFLLGGVTFLILSLPFFLDVIRDGVNSGQISSTSADVAVGLWLGFSITSCVIYFVLMAFAIVNGILGFKCLKAPNKKLLVTTIVFGFLSGTELTSVGAILGIISLNREKKD